MGPEVVAEHQMRTYMRMRRRKHVSVHNRPAIHNLVEVETPRNPILAAVAVTQSSHGRDGFGTPVRAVGNRNNVQDGLGRQSRHGGTADVVHLGDQREARVHDGRGLALENAGPFGVVFNDFHVRAMRPERPPISRVDH